MTQLIVYSLFLMLSNMGFSVESYELAVAPSGEGSTIAAQRPTKEITAIISFDFDITAKRDGLESAESDSEVAVQYLHEGQAKAPARSFSCTDNNSCKTVICTGGPIYNILTEINYFTTWCGNTYFDVIIEDCTFFKNTIDRHTFSGDFKLSTLTIRNCQLDTIIDNAFKYQSVNKLTNITFDGVQLKVLNAQTFNGLEAVKNFKLFNVLTQATSPLNANHFLQPMAASLSSLVFQQTEESDSFKTIYDPTGWLGGDSVIVYSKLLYVDLSGTKFNDTLNGNTFAKLSAVQELRLANCSLSTITENVFNGILSTLKSLDLRYNRLQTLDGGFLATALGKGIIIEFGWNLWSCDCDNVEIIEYMKQLENNSTTETVCATPTELQGIQIGNAQMRCYDTTTVITTIITPAPTSETTTIMTDTTAETTIETTESAPGAPPISSTTTSNNTSMPTLASTTTRTTETSSKFSPTPSTTPMNNSTTSLSSATNTLLTTAYDTTEETKGSNIKTSPTPFTTVINYSITDLITESSTKTIPFTTAINNPTTALDNTERTTISSTKTSTTLSTTPINNPSLPPSSPVTTTEDDTNDETTESSSKTSATPSTTPINNSSTDETTEPSSKNSPTSSTSAINHLTTAVDETEKTTTSRPKTSPATSPTSPTSTITPVNNSTSTTSSPPITKMPTTADDTNKETTESENTPITSTTTTIYSTTLSTSSSAASIHRWRW